MPFASPSIFQLTTSRRGRHIFRSRTFQLDRNFNSRPHEEVDRINCNGATHTTIISTHDLTKRSTITSTAFTLHDYISTHDLTKRSTAEWSWQWNVRSISTHDLTKRSTVFNYYEKKTELFQLTTSRRGRRFAEGWKIQVYHISTHDLTKRSTLWKALWRILAIFQLTTSRRGRHTISYLFCIF